MNEQTHAYSLVPRPILFFTLQFVFTIIHGTLLLLCIISMQTEEQKMAGNKAVHIHT